MRALTALLAVAVGGAGVARATPVRIDSTVLHTGITHERWQDDAIPATMDVVRINLTSAEIETRATPESEKGKTTSAYSADVGAAVAINGGPFAVAGYAPIGLAMGDGTMWSQTTDDALTGTLEFRREGEQTTAAIVAAETVVTAADLPAGTEGVVSGRPVLVYAGNVAGPFACDDDTTIACERAPRSAVGLSADGHTMYVVTVDGWQSGSLGMTAAELAAFIHARGAASAMMLDSGSSSTLVLDGGVANHPSDGVERTVANHLAFVYGNLPKGNMFGVICQDVLSNCTTLGMTGKIIGATVTLDDGRTDTSTATGCPDGNTCGSYSFASITPRYACVTVKKTGFRTARKCTDVPANDTGYNSVVLVAGTDPPDAGVPDDASETVVDASGSATDHPDGGTMGGGGGGGCCQTGSGRSPIALGALVAGWFLRRRGKRA